MADDDIKHDAEDSAEEVEAVAAETATEATRAVGKRPRNSPMKRLRSSLRMRLKLPQRLMPLPTAIALRALMQPQQTRI